MALTVHGRRITTGCRMPRRVVRAWVLRQDGFFSRQAPYGGACVVTKPLTFDGTCLLVNFSTSGGGWLRISVRDAAGRSAESVELFGDAVDAEVPFARGSLAAFAGHPVVVTFQMSDADLYSFRFSGGNEGT